MDGSASHTGVAAVPDHVLLRQVAQGSSDALAALYDRHAALVYGLARRVTGGREDAEEVVQDVFARVWTAAAQYDPNRANVAAWLVMMTRTRAIDRVRRRRARPDQAAGVEPAAIAPLTTSDPSPETLTLDAEEVRQVGAALGDLPEAQRTLIDLAFYGGLTHVEIATETGIPLGTVKTRLRTALLTLRRSLAPGGRA